MKSIIFKDFEVLAALKEQKTRFSVRLKVQPEIETGYDYPHENETGYFWKKEESYDSFDEMIEDIISKAPFKVGQKIFVKETWARYQTINHARRNDGGSFSEISDGLASYKADGFKNVDDLKTHIKIISDLSFEAIEVEHNKFQSPLTMPQWASRLTLEITGVRVERCQDISEEDAAREGFRLTGWIPSYNDPANSSFAETLTPADNFMKNWISKHGQQSWDNNDWIFAFDFKVVVK